MPNRTCSICKTKKPPESCLKVGLKFVCGEACKTQLIRKVVDKVRQHKAKEKKQKVKSEDIAHQHKLTQKAFNKMRVLEELEWFRERGLEPTCISCGNPKGNDQWCCGHLKTRGAQSNLRYDRKNTFLQHNHRCNMRLSGDIYGTKTTRGYIQGILERFGDANGQEILDYCETNTAPVKWSGEQLEAMRKEFNAIARGLKRKREQ